MFINKRTWIVSPVLSTFNFVICDLVIIQLLVHTMDPLDKIPNCKSSEELIALFRAHLNEIFAHDQQEVTDSLRSHSTAILLALRDDLFKKLTSLFPTFNGRDLWMRKKVKLAINDIYVIGFSVACNLEDTRLNKVCKPVNPNTSVDNLEEEDVASMALYCSTMKGTVDTLLSNINELRGRVNQLECDVPV